MEVSIKSEKKATVKTLGVSAGVRYWEDATVNEVEDTEGTLIPCRERDNWCPEIDVDKGVITNWEQGKSARIHYKVCDDGTYTLKDDEGKVVFEFDGYVPSCLCPEENGYGDYIIMVVSETGAIRKWKFDPKQFAEEGN